MSYQVIGIALSVSMLGVVAMAQTPSTGDSHMMASSAMAKDGAMASSARHTKMTKMDRMMVKNCKAMPVDKMKADKECQDYMTNHPDWMKSKK